MLQNKKFLILFLLLICVLSISIVSASQHDNDILNKNNNMFLTPQNNADLDFSKSIGILRCNDLTLYPTDDFTVRIIDDHLMPLEGEIVTFNINGKTYDVVTDEGGWAILSIPKDIKPGVYDIIISCRNQSVISTNNTI